jgi:hypothetical protein
LDRIFACNQRGCCASSKGGKGGKGDCGCDGKGAKGGMSAPAGSVEPPAPPAPVVDPSAFLQSQRRVMHASTNLVR